MGVSAAGFTLLEMLVTVAILALISGIAFPALQHVLARQALIAARGAVMLAVARGRSEAVRRDRPVRIDLAPSGSEGDALVIAGIAATSLPLGASIDWPHGGVVMFGDGSSSGARGVVRAGEASARFAIDPATARLEFAS